MKKLLLTTLLVSALAGRINGQTIEQKTEPIQLTGSVSLNHNSIYVNTAGLQLSSGQCLQSTNIASAAYKDNTLTGMVFLNYDDATRQLNELDFFAEYGRKISDKTQIFAGYIQLLFPNQIPSASKEGYVGATIVSGPLTVGVKASKDFETGKGEHYELTGALDDISSTMPLSYTLSTVAGFTRGYYTDENYYQAGLGLTIRYKPLQDVELSGTATHTLYLGSDQKNVTVAGVGLKKTF